MTVDLVCCSPLCGVAPFALFSSRVFSSTIVLRRRLQRLPVVAFAATMLGVNVFFFFLLWTAGACIHWLVFAGLAQCSELTWQLRGVCGKRQVPNASLALQHNVGLGGAVIVALYRHGFPQYKGQRSATSARYA